MTLYPNNQLHPDDFHSKVENWHISPRSFVANEKVIEIADRWLERIQKGYEAGSGYGMARVEFPTVREVYRNVTFTHYL